MWTERMAFARSCYDFIEGIGGHTSVGLQIDERCVQDKLLEGDMGPEAPVFERTTCEMCQSGSWV